MLKLQKASFWKRISACLFDITILSVVAIAFGLLIASIVNFDSYTEEYSNIQVSYESEYSIKFDKSDYDDLDDTSKAAYDIRYSQAEQDLSSNRRAAYLFQMLNSLTLLIITFGILMSFIILEFVIPLIFKNGQTLGKKIFNICLVRTDLIKVTGVSLFVRTFLGKFAIETMITVLCLVMLYFGLIGSEALFLIGGILLIQILMVLFTKNNQLIHDALAYTVVVDYSTQMIFDTEEQKNIYIANQALYEQSKTNNY